MKKIVSGIMIFILVFSLASCQNNVNQDYSKNSNLMTENIENTADCEVLSNSVAEHFESDNVNVEEEKSPTEYAETSRHSDDLDTELSNDESKEISDEEFNNAELEEFIHSKKLKVFHKYDFTDKLTEINYETEVDEDCTYTMTEYEESKSFDEMAVFVKSDQIYPGAIFRGDSIFDDEYIPINLPRKSIDISFSLQGKTDLKTSILNPRVISSARESINNFLNNENLSGSSTFDFEVHEAYNFEHLCMQLGVGVGVPVLKAKFDTASDSETETYKKYANFTQRYYSINVDPPVYSSNFFADDVTTKDLLEETGGVMPVYVSSVVYGRRGLFELSSDSSQSENQGGVSFETVIKGVDIQPEIKKTIEKNIKNESMHCYILGGDSDMAIHSIDGYEGFLEQIKAGASFSPDNRGEVIGYELRYLDDNSIAKVVINEKYKVKTKKTRGRHIMFEVEYIEPYKVSSKICGWEMGFEDIELYIDNVSVPLCFTNLRFSADYNKRYNVEKKKDGVENFRIISTAPIVYYSDPACSSACFSGNLEVENLVGDGGFFSQQYEHSAEEVLECVNVEHFKNGETYEINLSDVGVKIGIKTHIVYDAE